MQSIVRFPHPSFRASVPGSFDCRARLTGPRGLDIYSLCSIIMVALKQTNITSSLEGVTLAYWIQRRFSIEVLITYFRVNNKTNADILLNTNRQHIFRYYDAMTQASFLDKASVDRDCKAELRFSMNGK